MVTPPAFAAWKATALPSGDTTGEPIPVMFSGLGMVKRTTGSGAGARRAQAIAKPMARRLMSAKAPQAALSR